MTLEEKLQLMEQLWEDLSRHDSQIPPPAWHRALLSAREAMLREGKAKFVSWETMKGRLKVKTGSATE